MDAGRISILPRMNFFVCKPSIHSRSLPIFYHISSSNPWKKRRFFRSGLEISWGWQWTFSIKTFKWNTFRLQRIKNTSFFTMSGKGSRSNMATLSTHNSKSWETYPISPVYNILQNASELEVDINIKGVSNMFNLDINPSMIGCQLPAFLGWQDVVDCPGHFEDQRITLKF